MGREQIFIAMVSFGDVLWSRMSGGVCEVTLVLPRGLKRLLLEFMCFTRKEEVIT